MKLLPTVISSVTLVYLIYSFMVAQQKDQVIVKAINAPESITPAYISSTPLLVEQVWQQLKADRVKIKEPVEKKEVSPLENKDVLSIGEDKYALYGIFKSKLENQAFILIKALAKKEASTKAIMQKVVAGEELSKGITLVAVTSNSISFKQNDALIEFKLFEAKQ